ncbi:MAG: hypothetical protein ABW298_10630 [Candidatus Binatia bacterium]
MLARIAVSLLVALIGASCINLAAAPPPTADDSRQNPAPRPEPPRARADASVPEPSGHEVRVPAGGNLQAALDAAKPGDIITLQAGATYGAVSLPRKSGQEWITIRGSVAEPSGLRQGRVTPADAAHMPKIVATSDAAITTTPGAHHYRFQRIEIRPQDDRFVYNLVELGNRETSPEAVPHHFIFDRCYVHGDPRRGGRRGIALNSASTAIVGSYLSDFKEEGSDSQAIAGWNGPGPFLIEDNYIEAAGENLMFGGADPSIGGLVPSDIEIRGNRFSKKLAWKSGDPSYAGVAWSVKNLFELKNARRVVIERNTFEFNWAASQTGFAILFTVRNQDGSAPWSTVEDVTFAGNVVRHVGSGVNVLGHDSDHPSADTKRISIRDNLFYDVDGKRWGGSGTFLQVLAGVSDLVVEHNTVAQTGSVVVADGAPPNRGFVFRDNIVWHNAYGISGSDAGVGDKAIDHYFPGAVVTKNAFIGPWPSAGGATTSMYSRSGRNFFPDSAEKAGLMGAQTEDYRLVEASRLRSAASDGRDLGAPSEVLERARDARSTP